MTPRPNSLLRAQAIYYIATGTLPLVSMQLFERITGKKVDHWLVQMVGLLALSTGLSLLCESQGEKPRPSSVVLSVASAFSFAGIDIVHVLRRRISPIYLGDAAVQIAILVLLGKNAAS